MIRQLRKGLLPARRWNSSLLTKLSDAVQQLPMREAVRYKTKNIKWTASNIQDYSDAHANALAEYGMNSGDTIAVWLHDGPEKHITMLAAAKLGLRIADIDPTIDAVGQVREFLKLSQCKTIVFAPSFGDTNYIQLLRKAIPEFYEYDDTHGQHFHSKHFPSLKLFIHTGFDTEMGAHTYKSLFLPDAPMPSPVVLAVSKLKDDTPAYFRIHKDAPGRLVTGPVLTHANLLADKHWYFANKFASQEYFECDI